MITNEQIEALAVKHESFGFGQVDAKGLTIHGFDPDGLSAFVTELLASRDVEVADLRAGVAHEADCAESYKAEADHLRERVALMQRQVYADVAQILRWLDVIDSARGPTAATEGIHEHAQHIEKIVLAAMLQK